MNRPTVAESAGRSADSIKGIPICQPVSYLGWTGVFSWLTDWAVEHIRPGFPDASGPGCFMVYLGSYYQGCFHVCSYTMYHIPWFIFRRKRQIWVYHGIPCLTHTHTCFLDDLFTQSSPDGKVFFYHEISIGFTQNHLFGDDYIYV